MSEEIAVAVAETVVETVVETVTEVAPAIPIAITALAYTGAGAIAVAGCYGIYRLAKWGHGKYKVRKELKASATAPAAA